MDLARSACWFFDVAIGKTVFMVNASGRARPRHYDARTDDITYRRLHTITYGGFLRRRFRVASEWFAYQRRRYPLSLDCASVRSHAPNGCVPPPCREILERKKYLELCIIKDAVCHGVIKRLSNGLTHPI